MYPHYHYPHFWRRGPSRLLWFVVGAGAATWWHKHHEMHNSGWTWGHCRRAAIQNSPSNMPLTADGSTVNAGVSDSSFSLKDIPRTINNIPAAGWGWGGKQEVEKSKEDHMTELQRQATEAMSDMTEATLESILSGAEALKAKLVASRELRKKQEEQLKRELEEQSKKPPLPA